MNQVQVEQKAYRMPPQDGITIAHFIVVADIERSARFYQKVCGARILSRGDSKGAQSYMQIAKHVAHCQCRARSDARQTIDNAQRPRRSRYSQQLCEYPRRGYSSVLCGVEKSASRVHHGAKAQTRRDALLHPRSWWLHYRSWAKQPRRHLRLERSP
jgi:hypothetical protein